MPIGAPSWCGPDLHETGHEFDRSPCASTAITPRLLDNPLNQTESRSQSPADNQSSNAFRKGKFYSPEFLDGANADTGQRATAPKAAYFEASNRRSNVLLERSGGHGGRTRNRFPGTTFPMSPLAIRLPSKPQFFGAVCPIVCPIRWLAHGRTAPQTAWLGSVYRRCVPLKTRPLWLWAETGNPPRTALT